jgi:HEAT repeats
VRAAICTSLERIADESVLEEIVELASDQSLGAERGMAVVALGNMRHARARVTPLLVELLSDEQVELFSLLGLSKLGARDTTASSPSERDTATR